MNILHLTVSEIGLDKIFKVKVTIARSMVKSRSHYDVAHLQLLTNAHTKYEHPTPYGLRDMDRPPSRTPWLKTIPKSLLRMWGNKNGPNVTIC